MKRLPARFVALAFLAATSAAFALPETFQISQVYSNDDGRVQFVMVHDSGRNDCDANEAAWSGLSLVSTGSGPQHTYVFPANLPTCKTSGRNILIATQTFASLGLVTPDYVIPDGFAQIPGGTLTFAGISSVTYTALPSDGTHAIDAAGTVIQNQAINLAGAAASVVPANIPPAASLNFEGLFYNAPAESEAGWGINFTHQGDVIFATWFTYDINGRAWWLTMSAERAAANTYAGKLYETRGPAFNSVPFDPAAVTVAEVGSGTLTFADVDHGMFHYTVNGVEQTKSLVRQMFGTAPKCAFGAQPDLSLATNYQDLWWAAPPGVESGWGVNFTHQDDVIFATWFTYDFDGKPLWLSATARKTTPGVYTGTLYRTTGPAFSAMPWDKTALKLTQVGDLTLTFVNGNSASFHYTLSLGTPPVSVDQVKQVTRQVFRAPGTACQ